MLARCQSDGRPLRPVIRTLQALEHQFSLKELVVSTAFLRAASFPTHPTPLHNSCLSSLFHCLSQSINQYHYIRGVLTLSRPSLGHTDPSGAAPWAVIPLFLSRVGPAPPLALSLAWASRPLFLLLSWALRPPLSLSLARAGLAPPPPSHVGSAPTSMLCTAGAVPLSPGHSLARDTPACPKSLLCLSDLSFLINLCDGS